MRKLYKGIYLCFFSLLVFTQTSLYSQPVNDLCSGAQVIPAAGPFPYLTTTIADITLATTTGDPPLPSCQTNVSRSIWYSLTPTTTALYGISSCASEPTASTVDDLVIAIYTSAGGCAGPFTQLIPNASSCDDDGCTTEALQAVIAPVALNAGTTYFIVVWKFDTPAPTVGNTAVQLKITQAPIPVPPPNDNVSGAIPLTLNLPVNGTTAAAANDYALSGPACFVPTPNTASTVPGNDVVYTFTAPVAGIYNIQVYNYNPGNNFVLYIANSMPGGVPPQVVTCTSAANRVTGTNSSEMVYNIPLVLSQVIYIVVDENAVTTGSSFSIIATNCIKETEPNATPATANSLNLKLLISGEVTPASDVDFFSLGTPAVGSRIFAMINGVAANSSDFDLRVTTTTDCLEYDDLNSDIPFGSLSPTIAGTPATGVASFLRVSHFSAATVSQPYLLVSKTELPSASATAETEPNDIIAQTNTGPGYFSGSLTGPAPSADADIFRFTAVAGDVVFVALDADPLRNNTPIDVRLEILDFAGTQLIVVNDAGSTSSTTTGAGSLTSTTPNSPAEGIIFRPNTSGIYYVRVTIGTASTGTIGSGDYLLSISSTQLIPTPVSLFSFTGQKTSAGNQLKWSTSSEQNSSYFELERSSHGNQFTGIATVPAAGNSSADRHYGNLDSHPLIGNNFYRLKIFNTDASYKYSNVVLINSGKAGDLSIFPNPFSNELKFYMKEAYGVFNLRLYNAQGEEVLNRSLISGQSVNTSVYPPGIYFYNIVSGDGTTYTGKLIKQ